MPAPCQTCGGTGRVLSIPMGWKMDGTYEASRCDRCDGTGTSRPTLWHDASMVRAQQCGRDQVAAGQVRVR